MLLVLCAQSLNFPKTMKLTLSSPSKLPIIHPSTFCPNISSLLTRHFGSFSIPRFCTFWAVFTEHTSLHSALYWGFSHMIPQTPIPSNIVIQVKRINVWFHLQLPSWRSTKFWVLREPIISTDYICSLFQGDKFHPTQVLPPTSISLGSVLFCFPFIYWFLDWIPKAQVTKVKTEKWNYIEEAAAHQGIEENIHKLFIWQRMNLETILKI